MDQQILNFVSSLITGGIAPAVIAAAVLSWKLRGVNETVAKLARDVLQNAANTLEKNQADKFDALSERLRHVEEDRHSLQIQVKALTQIVEDLKKDHEAEREAFRKQIGELQSRIDALTQERDHLLLAIETLKRERHEVFSPEA